MSDKEKEQSTAYSQELNEKNSEKESNREDSYFYALFEAVLFLYNDPLPAVFFVKNFEIEIKNAKIILDSLVDEYEERDGGIKLIQIAGGYQFVAHSKYADEIRRVMSIEKRESLTKGMLETLSIIAYKQPTILAEVDQLRGVSSRAMLAKLMRKNLVKPVGRKNVPGRPLLYGTTDDFLKHFGLNNLSDLPDLSEIDEYTGNNNLDID